MLLYYSICLYFIPFLYFIVLKMTALQELHELIQKQQNLQTQLAYQQTNYEKLTQTYNNLQQQLDQLNQTPLLIGQIVEILPNNRCVVNPSNSLSNYAVRVSSHINPAQLHINQSVAMNRVSYTIVAILPSIQEGDQTVSTTKVNEITFNDVGGYEQQKHEIKEAVIDPIKNYQFFQQLQIKPPNATLLYGPPGCGKSFIASAVAYMSGCNFISVSASNCVQKYLGEGARYIREIFNQAREKAPCIVFFDEIDAIAQKRRESATDGDQEVQRILNELLTQIDGFNGISQNPEKPVKVIFATNQIQSIDPALLRSGRCDRRILIDYPTKREKRAIFNVCTKDMSLQSGIDFEVYIQKAVKISGADIRQICIEAGMQAIRDGRWQCTQQDFDKAWENVVTIGKSKEKKQE